MDSIKKLEEKWMSDVEKARAEHQDACLEKECNKEVYSVFYILISIQQFQILSSCLWAYLHDLRSLVNASMRSFFL